MMQINPKTIQKAIREITDGSACNVEHTADLILAKLTAQFIDSTTEYELNIDGAHFTITPLDDRTDGYPGIVRSDAYIDPTKEKVAKVSDDIIEKAVKNPDFILYFNGYPYLLACYDSSYLLERIEYESMLFGTSCSIGNNPQLPGAQEFIYKKEVDKIYEMQEWVRISDARNAGWSDYLHKVNRIPNNFRFIKRFGLYSREKAMNGVSVVFIFHKNSDHCLLPNPFAQGDINLLNDPFWQLNK